jgi:hypothetical protein
MGYFLKVQIERSFPCRAEKKAEQQQYGSKYTSTSANFNVLHFLIA